MKFNGLILAGGNSSRMGFNKATINYHGAPQFEWLHDLLKNYCDEIYISGNPDFLNGNYEFIFDSFDRGGPLNGILSAHLKFPDSNWIVLPVDMPNINHEVIDLLLKSHTTNDLATCFINKEKYIDPLPVILSNKACKNLFNRFNNQEESLNKFLVDCKCNTISPGNPDWLKNINYPSQLEL